MKILWAFIRGILIILLLLLALAAGTLVIAGDIDSILRLQCLTLTILCVVAVFLLGMDESSSNTWRNK